MIQILKKQGDSFAVILLGLFILYHIYFQMSIAVDLKSGLDSPILFPKIVGVLLIVLGLFQVITTSFKQRKEKEDRKEVLPDNKRLGMGMGILFVYVLLIPLLGFVIASVLTIFSLVYVFQKVKWHKAALYAAISSALIWTVFEFFLQITLPVGVFGI